MPGRLPVNVNVSAQQAADHDPAMLGVALGSGRILPSTQFPYWPGLGSESHRLDALLRNGAKLPVREVRR